MDETIRENTCSIVSKQKVFARLPGVTGADDVSISRQTGDNTPSTGDRGYM